MSLCQKGFYGQKRLCEVKSVRIWQVNICTHTWCSSNFFIGTKPSQNSQGNIVSEDVAELLTFLSLVPDERMNKMM